MAAVSVFRARPLHVILQSHVKGLQASSVGIAVLLAFTMLIPTAWAAASPSAPDASGYEIPLGELNKVKKERPQKKEKKSRKKKKVENAAQQPLTDVAVPIENTGRAPTAPVLPDNAGRTDSPPQTVLEQTDKGASGKPEIPQPPAVAISIHHDPYSYVVAGKRTIVQAVISSADSLRSVSCRFRALEDGAFALVPMVLAPGTNFTYTATLPSLASASRTLRYSISAEDMSGNENRSPEFVIPVKSPSVMPGWQLASSPDKIMIRLEQRGKPLEGFSDTGLVE
jgi:hypothetical protein